MEGELIMIEGDRQSRSSRPVTVQASLNVTVVLQVRHVDHRRLPGEGKVEEDAGVVRDQDIGRHHEFLDAWISTDVNQPGTGSGTVHVVCAHEDHRIGAMSRIHISLQSLPVAVPSQAPWVTQPLAPGRRIEDDLLLLTDTEIGTHPPPHLYATK